MEEGHYYFVCLSPTESETVDLTFDGAPMVETYYIVLLLAIQIILSTPE
jgi:hypothetical protein